MRKIIGPVVTLALIVGVGAAIWMSANTEMDKWQKVVARGLSGSEKMPFFQDPRVVEALAKQGIEVDVKKSGSREIATRHDLTQYDFAFPAGIPAAEKIQREHKKGKSYQVAFTPMVVASWEAIAQVLAANGIVEKRDDSYFIVDMKKLLSVIEEGKRWTDLENHKPFPARKSVLINSTDIRRSNSAAMYLALASYLLNGEAVVENPQQADALIDRAASLFIRQGYTEHSSAVPFNDYLVMGIGKAPMVMAYESQYLFAASQGQLRSGMELLYPEPTLFTKHVLVAFTPAGERLGEALMNDPELQALMIDHGWRNQNVTAFDAFLKKHDLHIPATLFNIIEPPSYEIVESMIQRIEAEHYGGAH